MNIPEINENNTIVTSIRHFEALTAAHDAITRVIEGMKNQLPTDLLTIDLRICLHSLAEITGGEITPDETLSQIYLSTFASESRGSASESSPISVV